MSIVEIDDLIERLRDLFNFRHALCEIEINASRPLPSRVLERATSSFVQLTSCWWFLRAQRSDKRSHELRLDLADLLFSPNCASHVCACRRCHCIDHDIVFRAFAGSCLGEADHAAFLTIVSISSTYQSCGGDRNLQQLHNWSAQNCHKHH